MKKHLVMSSLAAAVFLAVGAYAGNLHAQPQPGTGDATQSDHVVSDTWITTKVKAELATTKGVESTDISVKTVNGVVTLTGVLATDIDVKKAVAAAKSVEGVKQVDASGLKSKD